MPAVQLGYSRWPTLKPPGSRIEAQGTFHYGFLRRPEPRAGPPVASLVHCSQCRRSI